MNIFYIGVAIGISIIGHGKYGSDEIVVLVYMIIWFTHISIALLLMLIAKVYEYRGYNIHPIKLWVYIIDFESLMLPYIVFTGIKRSIRVSNNEIVSFDSNVCCFNI